MTKILSGLFALLVIAVVVGAATHWIFGVAVAVIPVTVVYLRLKLSSNYRIITNQIMEDTLGH